MFNIFKRYYYRILVELDNNNMRGYYVVKAKNKTHAEQRLRRKIDSHSTIIEIELL
jgi:hypothetical protein